MNIRKMIMFEEGVKLQVYLDTKNIPTVGIGHSLVANNAMHILGRKLKVGDVITKAECEALFKEDLEQVQAALETNIDGYKNFPEHYKSALINLAFNIGSYGIKKWVKMLDAMKREDDEEVINEIKNSKWFHQLPNRANRVIKLLKKEEVKEYN